MRPKTINYKPYKRSLSTIKTEGKPGQLHWNNLEKDFLCKRVLVLSDFSDLNQLNRTRGNHSNSDCNEILFVVKGGVDISLKKDQDHHLYSCKKNDYVMIPKNYFLKIKILSKDTICLVLCDSKR